MYILVTGQKNRLAAIQPKLSKASEVIFLQDTNPEALAKADLIIDLNFDEQPGSIEKYRNLHNKPVLVSAALLQLASLGEVQCQLFGLNCLETFLERPLLEVSAAKEEEKPVLENMAAQLELELQWVADRVGMVSPRIICMIINEACFTVQEGTAGMKDIDLGMKLGTNYPMGPFEWGDKIGVNNVYKLLESVYQDTHDARYKICPLLKTHYLQQRTFIA